MCSLRFDDQRSVLAVQIIKHYRQRIVSSERQTTARSEQ